MHKESRRSGLLLYCYKIIIYYHFFIIDRYKELPQKILAWVKFLKFQSLKLCCPHDTQCCPYETCMRHPNLHCLSRNIKLAIRNYKTLSRNLDAAAQWTVEIGLRRQLLPSTMSAEENTAGREVLQPAYIFE